MFVVHALRSLTARLGQEDRGATAVEYGLMVALIAAVIIFAVILLGDQITQAFCEVVNAVADEGIGAAGECGAAVVE